MASINISLTEEAYNYLKMLKGNKKSFSDVVLNIKQNDFKKGSKENVLRFAGCLKDKNIDWEKVNKNMNEFRKSFNERVEKTEKYMRR